MSHTVTVTRAFDTPGADSEDAEYVIEGTCDQCCESYYECHKDWHRHPSAEYGDREENWATKRVPEVHTWLNGAWMLPEKNQCGFNHAFEVENPEWQMTETGTYQVDIDWDGDWWTAQLHSHIPTTEATQ